AGGGSDGRVIQKPARLVVPVGGDGGELLLVAAAVVGAEEQIALADHDADVGLGAAAVAAVRGSDLVGLALDGCRASGCDLRHLHSHSLVSYTYPNMPPRNSLPCDRVFRCPRRSRPFGGVGARHGRRGSLGLKTVRRRSSFVGGAPIGGRIRRSSVASSDYSARHLSVLE